MLWVVVCVPVYVFSILEVGSGVDESRDCVFLVGTRGGPIG